MSTTRRVHPACFLLVAASFALLGTACSETKTPTEMVVQPSPVPTPTAASLSGVVKDQAGNPFGGPGNLACVLSDRSEYWVSIGPMGAYSISGLVAGKATVKIYIQGQFIPQTFGVDLQPGANTRDFAVVVQHGEPATMSGTVTSALEWAKPAGMTVFCQGKGATVGSDGRYILAGLESGRWDVMIDLNNAFDHSSFPAVTLKAGPNTVDFAIR